MALGTIAHDMRGSSSAREYTVTFENSSTYHMEIINPLDTRAARATVSTGNLVELLIRNAQSDALKTLRCGLPGV